MSELEKASEGLPVEAGRLELPPVLAGHESPLVAKKVEGCCSSGYQVHL